MVSPGQLDWPYQYGQLHVEETWTGSAAATRTTSCARMEAKLREYLAEQLLGIGDQDSVRSCEHEVQL